MIASLLRQFESLEDGKMEGRSVSNLPFFPIFQQITL
jgi:hypothetical protein